ncbi:MAG: XdhC family protein [Alphaproteobacteria bacterium]|nr:XdhC family protein [Alphaproteobacteria bacterium]
MKGAILAAVQAARASGRPAVLATAIPEGTQALISPDGAGWAVQGDAVPAALFDPVRAALASDENGIVEAAGGRWFLHVHNPPLRLIVVGAVHIAQPLAPMAAMAGFATTIVDPRGAFATAERFPGVTLSDLWPDEAMDAFRPDARTAVVTLTHDPKLDDPALDRALKSPAFYIGALGSRKTHAARLKRLAEMGHGPEVLARIRGPVGLSIEAVTPAEIALSILAEVVAVRRNAPLAQRPAGASAAPAAA